MFRHPRPGSTSIPVLLLLFTLLLLVSPIAASSGDRHPLYKSCVNDCITQHCAPPQTRTLSPLLRLLRWTCRDDCSYHCTHQVTNTLQHDPGLAAKFGGKVYHQFHGKWPFWRIMGVQEPASVLFSLGNFWVHWNGWRKLRRRVSGSLATKRWMMALAIVQMNTWTWSAIFHTRDTPFTEKMDYFSASATIMFTVHYTILRLFNLFPSPPQRQQTPRTRYLLSITCILLYIAHISYLLSTPRFDYAWNILFNLCLGAVHLALWSIFSLRFTVRLPFPLSLIPTPYPPLDPLQITPKPQYSKTSALLVLGTTLAMSLELFDFPPIGRTIDAHSLWHFATVIIARGWYEFMIRDAAMLEAARMTFDPVAAGRVAEKMAEVVGGREKGVGMGIMHGQSQGQQQQQQQQPSRSSGGYPR